MIELHLVSFFIGLALGFGLCLIVGLFWQIFVEDGYRW